MGMYAVTVVGDGGVVIDHATTADMGRPDADDRTARELAESYAHVAVIQAERDGFRGFYAVVRSWATGAEVLRLPSHGDPEYPTGRYAEFRKGEES